jgi:hypothetical protein
VDTDLDTLATALFVKTDDLLKSSPQLAPWRPTVGITPQLSDAELVTLAMMQAILGFTSEARWLRHAHAHLRHLFPYLPKQPGYNKRLRKAANLVRQVTRELATDTALWTDDVWVVDSTPVECGRSRETAKRSGLPPIAFALTGAKADERQTLLDIFATEPELVSSRPGQTLIGDKNYSAESSKHSSPTCTSSCCARPAREKPSEPDHSCSSHCGRSSSQSTKHSKDSSTSNDTTAALPVA